MQDWLKSSAYNNPHMPALMTPHQQWTYRELHAQAAIVEANLAGRGVLAGDRVAVLMPNRAEFVGLAHAVWWRQATLVPLNTRLTLDELVWQIGQITPKLLVYSAETQALASGLDAPKIFINDLLKTPSNGNLPSEQPFDPQAIACMMFTSGTSGQPKAVMLTHDNFFWSAMGSALRIGTLPQDRWLCCIPLYHIGGLSIAFRSALYGTAVSLENGFDVASIQRAFDTQDITLISLVPTMLYRLLDAKVRFPSSLRLILLGGAAASPELLEKCRTQNLPIAPTYGLTEACSQVATLLPKTAYHKPDSVGKALPFTSISVLDENDFPARTGEHGQIVVQGWAVMKGYYNNSAASAKTLQDGRLFTGDIGYFDEDGDLHVMLRRSDLIVSGGENVYPAEVEAILRQHPAVEDASVVGVPSAEWGQQVAAAVVLKRDMNTDSAEIIAFCRGHLAGYKVPRQVRFVASLPKTASGKIQRTAVIDLVLD